MNTISIAEAVLLDSWSEILSLESWRVALNSTVGLLELEFSELVGLLEWNGSTVVRSHSSEYVNSIALA